MGKRKKPVKRGLSRPKRPPSPAAAHGPGTVEAGAGLFKFLEDAVNQDASAVHIEPLPDGIQVRIRKKGQLQVWGALRREHYNSLIEDIKRFEGQGGPGKGPPYRFHLRLRHEKTKLRFLVTSIPTIWGETIAVEILREGPPIELDLGRLGFEKDGLDQFRDAIRQRHGLVIVTGPIESGKKTTIYAALTELNKAKMSIATAEWYIRRRLKGIQQTVVSDRGPLDQETAMETLLKSDVDVIYVQEMHQSGAPDVIVRAALNDKLIFTEFHALDAPRALIQLSCLNFERWQITNAVLLINAQRLLRRLCPACREEIAVNEGALLEAGLSRTQLSAGKIYRAVGCAACDDAGYQGRVLVCETMPFTADLKEAFTAGASSGELKAIAVRGGMSTLRMSGLKKVLAGLTTLDEVLLATPSDRS